MERIVAPPWELTGNGFIFLYRFDRAFVEAHVSASPDFPGVWRTSLGAVMLIDYLSSPVGPYRELLFIPGRYKVGGKRYYHISRIYVSTQASVDNGRENWGIPKQVADFEIEEMDVRRKRWTVSQGGVPFFHAETKAGLLRLPVNTIMNPFPTALLQRRERDGALLKVDPYGGGTMSFAASLLDVVVDAAYFPDVSTQKPLGVLEAVNFHLNFPVPLQVD